MSDSSEPVAGFLNEPVLLRHGHLSMRKVVGQALVVFFRNLPTIVVTMVIPVVLMVALQELMRLAGWSIIATSLVYALGWMILWVGFASVLHGRFLGLKVAPWRSVIWTRAQLNFLFGILKLIGVMILLGLLTSLLSFVPLGGVVATLIAAFVWARYAMVFPSAAVGRPLSLGASWDLTAHSKWRVALLVGTLYIVGQFLLGFVIAASSIAGPALGQSPVVTSLAGSVLAFLVAAIVVAVLSSTYRGLMQTRPADVRDQYLPEEGSHLVDAF